MASSLGALREALDVIGLDDALAQTGLPLILDSLQKHSIAGENDVDNGHSWSVYNHLSDLRLPDARRKATDVNMYPPKAISLRLTETASHAYLPQHPSSPLERLVLSITNNAVEAFHDALIDYDSATCDAVGWTPLHYCAVNTDAPSAALMMCALVEHPTFAHLVDARTAAGTTPLMLCASMGGSYAAVDILLLAGADIHARTPTGSTALHCAVDAGRVDIAELLCLRGASTHLRALVDGSREWDVTSALRVFGATPRDIAILRHVEVPALAPQQHQSLVRFTLTSAQRRSAAAALSGDISALGARSALAIPDAPSVAALTRELFPSATDADIADIIAQVETHGSNTVVPTPITGPQLSLGVSLDIPAALQQRFMLVAERESVAAALLVLIESLPHLRQELGDLACLDALALRLKPVDHDRLLASGDAGALLVGYRVIVVLFDDVQSHYHCLLLALETDGVRLGSCNALMVEQLIGRAGGVGSLVNVDEALAFALHSSDSHTKALLGLVGCCSDAIKQQCEASSRIAEWRRQFRVVSASLGVSVILPRPSLAFRCSAKQGVVQLFQLVCAVTGEERAMEPRNFVEACRHSPAGSTLEHMLSARPFLVNEPDPVSREWPLSAAVRAKNSAVVLILLQLGARILVQDGDGATPLTIACRAGDEASALSLATRHPELNRDRGPHGLTPLIAALLGPNPRIAAQLVRLGADVHLSDDFGLCPIDATRYNNASHSLRQLLQHGATANGALRVVFPTHNGCGGVMSEMHTVANLVHDLQCHLQPLRRDVDGPGPLVENAYDAVDRGIAAADPDIVRGPLPWFVAPLIHTVDALQRLVRYFMLYPPQSLLTDFDSHLHESRRIFECCVNDCVTLFSNTPVNQTLNHASQTKLVAGLQLALDRGASCLLLHYARPQLDDLVSHHGEEPRFWMKAFAGAQVGAFLKTDELIDIIASHPPCDALRSDRLGWRRQVLRDLFDPHGTGTTSILRYMQVAILTTHQGQSFEQTAMEALLLIAERGALRLYWTREQCCSTLALADVHSYCVSVGEWPDLTACHVYHITHKDANRRKASASSMFRPSEIHFADITMALSWVLSSPDARHATGAIYAPS